MKMCLYIRRSYGITKCCLSQSELLHKGHMFQTKAQDLRFNEDRKLRIEKVEDICPSGERRSCFIRKKNHGEQTTIGGIPENFHPVKMIAEIKRHCVAFMSPEQRSARWPVRRTVGVSVGWQQLKSGSSPSPWPSPTRPSPSLWAAAGASLHVNWTARIPALSWPSPDCSWIEPIRTPE